MKTLNGIWILILLASMGGPGCRPHAGAEERGEANAVLPPIRYVLDPEAPTARYATYRNPTSEQLHVVTYVPRQTIPPSPLIDLLPRRNQR